MSNIKDIVPSSVEIVLGDNTFTVKTISLGDIADFQRWCDKQKKREIIEVYELAGKEVNIKEVMNITGDEQYYESMMNSLGGVIHLLHKVIHKSNDTEITEEEIADQLDFNNVQEIIETLFGGIEGSIIPAEGDKSKNVKAKSRQKK